MILRFLAQFRILIRIDWIHTFLYSYIVVDRVLSSKAWNEKYEKIWKIVIIFEEYIIRNTYTFLYKNIEIYLQDFWQALLVHLFY